MSDVLFVQEVCGLQHFEILSVILLGLLQTRYETTFRASNGLHMKLKKYNTKPKIGFNFSDFTSRGNFINLQTQR